MIAMRYKEELEETTRELKAQMKRKDAILLEDQGEIVQLKSALDLTTRNLKEKERAYRELNDQFSKLKLASDQATRQIRHMQQSIDEKEKQLKEALHQLQKLQKDNKRHAVVFDGATVVGNIKPTPGSRKWSFPVGKLLHGLEAQHTHLDCQQQSSIKGWSYLRRELQQCQLRQSMLLSS